MEQRDLCFGTELLDIIGHQQRCVAVEAAMRATSSVCRACRSLEQVRASAASLTPQINKSLSSSGHGGAQMQQRLRVAAHDEIIERRRGRGGDIQRELLHELLLSP